MTQTRMATCLALTALLAGGRIAAAAPAFAVRHLRLPLVGRTVVYVPAQPTTRVVLVVSGDGGWEPRVARIAEHLAPRMIVIGVPYPPLARAAARRGGCWYVASDLELLSHQAQRLLNLPQYTPPVLIGYASGAAAVYAALAPAPAVTFAGAVSLAFSPDLPAARAVCRGETWFPRYNAARHDNALPPSRTLPKDWYVLQGAEDRVTPPAAIARFAAGMPRAHVIEVPGTGHGFARADRWAPALDRAVDALWEEAERTPVPGRPPPPAIGALEASLKRLGVPFEFRMPAAPEAFMVFLSGDGGWASIDQNVSERLMHDNIGVVGVSSLRYFWQKKTPAEVASLLRSIVSTLAVEGKPIFAGGYSFGAEVVPVSLREWTPAERRALSGLVLLAPGFSATFEINPLDWIREPKIHPRTMVAPAVRASGLPALCIQGAAETDSGCADLEHAPGVRVLRLRGGHHFGDHYAALAGSIVQFMRDHHPAGAGRP
ncbi:MAG TPA: AcvB/VirJ family lysyl-phosphatidylglycerol hydrolase [Vicinamibacterales bacterium]|nr:AcvB/VirJ family lysyl-phosphatidylglycerol hydrolase [Vicinamibacterales bacterium]